MQGGLDRKPTGNWPSPFHRSLAGEIARELGQWEEVQELYSRAAQYYAEEGRPVAAAEAGVKAARALEERKPEVIAVIALSVTTE